MDWKNGGDKAGSRNLGLEFDTAMDLDNAAQGKEIAVKVVMKLLLREIHCG